jgi:YD repeat-containing protein
MAPTTLYAYSPQTFAGTTFSGGKGTYQFNLTGYGVITTAPATPTSANPVQEAVLGLFSYGDAPTGLLVPSVVIEAASGVISNELLRDVQLSYQPQQLIFTRYPAFILTTAKLNGGVKTIVSRAPAPGMWRLSSITSTAGSGSDGEVVSERWTWSNNLTLSEYVDGNNNRTTFGSYDVLGNPTSITEAGSDNEPHERTTTITYHPVLSRPLVISTASLDGKLEDQHTLIFDYSSAYDSNCPAESTCNTQPAPLSTHVHQIIESGWTSPGLTGRLDTFQSRVVQIFYDNQNRVTSISGPNVPSAQPTPPNFVPALTTYDYFPSTGYLAHENRSVGNGEILTTSFSNYDADGRVQQVTDPNGNVRKTTYDAQGRIVAQELDSKDGTQRSAKQLDYDLAGDLIQEITPEGNFVRTDYDSALRPWRLAGLDAQGSGVWSRVTDYDLWGQVVTVRSFAGLGPDEGFGCTKAGTEQFCEEFGYDPYERLTSVHTLEPNTNDTCGGPVLNCTTTYTYDGNGIIRTTGEFENGVTTYTPDSLNRIVSIRNKAGGLTTLTYDMNDHVIARRDARDPASGGTGASGRITTYVYDDFGSVVLASSPDIGQWYSSYDPAANLMASKDNAGEILNYRYDGLSRRTAVVSPRVNESIAFLYDESGDIASSGVAFANSLGRLTSIHASNAKGDPIRDHFVYDYRGWRVSDVQELPYPYGMWVSKTLYNFGDNHELNSITYPDGLVASYKYATSGSFAPTPKPTEVDTIFNRNTTVVASGITYYTDGKVQGLTLGSGSALSVVRNKRGEATDITSGAPNGAPIVQQHYVYDADVVG